MLAVLQSRATQSTEISADGWQAATLKHASLANGEAHAWLVRLDQLMTTAELTECLTPDELERAAKFHFTRDRQQYVATRYFLRNVVAAYQQTTASSIRFDYNAHGKPELDDAGDPPLRVNVSHAGGYALVGVTRDGQIGVDIEPKRTIPDLLELARTSFTSTEFSRLQRLPASAQIEAFFVTWTRREACLKAAGNGLTLARDAIDVSCDLDDLNPVLTTHGLPSPDAWSVWTLQASQSLLASIAMIATGVRLRCFRFDPAC